MGTHRDGNSIAPLAMRRKFGDKDRSSRFDGQASLDEVEQERQSLINESLGTSIDDLLDTAAKARKRGDTERANRSLAIATVRIAETQHRGTEPEVQRLRDQYHIR